MLAAKAAGQPGKACHGKGMRCVMAGALEAVKAQSIALEREQVLAAMGGLLPSARAIMRSFKGPRPVGCMLGNT